MFRLFFLIVFITSSLSTLGQSSFVTKFRIEPFYQFISSCSDNDGNLYTAHTVVRPIGRYEEGLRITRINSSGTVSWTRIYWSDSAAFAQVRPVSMVTDNFGNVFVTGYFAENSSESENYETFIFSVDKQGNNRFFKTLLADFADYTYAIDRIENDLLVYSNNANPSSSASGRNRLLRIDNNGNIIWSNSYFNTNTWGRLFVSKSNQIYIHDHKNIVKISGNGNIIWSKALYLTSCYLSDFGEDNNGNLYIAAFSTSVSFKIGFLIHISASGKLTKLSHNFYFQNVFGLGTTSNGDIIIAANGLDSSVGMVSGLHRFAPNGTYKNTHVLTDSVSILRFMKFKNFNKGLFGFGVTDTDVWLLKANSGLSGKCFIEKRIHETNDVQLVTTPDQGGATKSNFPITSFTHKIISESVAIPNLTFCKECAPKTHQNINDTALCFGNSFMINEEGWDSIYLNGKHQKQPIVLKESGNYTLKLSNECSVSLDTFRLTINPAVPKKFTISKKDVSLHEPVFFRSGQNPIAPKWMFEDGYETKDTLFTRQFQNNGNYNFTIVFKDSLECTDTIEDSIIVRYFSLFIPNAFSPDANHKNDTFGPVGLGIKSYTLTIMNRWGEVVFEGHNEQWDGNVSHLPAPEGNYYYALKYEDIFERQGQRNGTFILLR